MNVFFMSPIKFYFSLLIKSWLRLLTRVAYLLELMHTLTISVLCAFRLFSRNPFCSLIMNLFFMSPILFLSPYKKLVEITHTCSLSAGINSVISTTGINLSKLDLEIMWTTKSISKYTMYLILARKCYGGQSYLPAYLR